MLFHNSFLVQFHECSQVVPSASVTDYRTTVTLLHFVNDYWLRVFL